MAPVDIDDAWVDRRADQEGIRGAEVIRRAQIGRKRADAASLCMARFGIGAHAVREAAPGGEPLLRVGFPDLAGGGKTFAYLRASAAGVACGAQPLDVEERVFEDERHCFTG